VKDFANRMITDHGKAGDELKPIAQEMNVTLPQKVSAERQTSKRVWQPGSGSHGAYSMNENFRAKNFWRCRVNLSWRRSPRRTAKPTGAWHKRM
jgi:hypothetical protein